MTIAAGDTQTVSFQLGTKELSYWSSAAGGLVQDATTIDVLVGGDSCADLATTLFVTG